MSAPKPEEGIPSLRDTLEIHRIEMEEGVPPDTLFGWVKEENANFDPQRFGFQEFTEFLNFAQDKLVVRLDADEEKGLLYSSGRNSIRPRPRHEPKRSPSVLTTRSSRSCLGSRRSSSRIRLSPRLPHRRSGQELLARGLRPAATQTGRRVNPGARQEKSLRLTRRL